MEEDGRKPRVSNEESERQSLRKECPMDVTNVKPDALNEASKGHPCPLGQLLRPFRDTDGVRSGDTSQVSHRIWVSPHPAPPSSRICRDHKSGVA